MSSGPVGVSARGALRRLVPDRTIGGAALVLLAIIGARLVQAGLAGL